VKPDYIIYEINNEENKVYLFIFMNYILNLPKYLKIFKNENYCSKLTFDDSFGVIKMVTIGNDELNDFAYTICTSGTKLYKI
jgi:hypothetical protein